MERKRSAVKGIIWLTLAALVLAALFYWVVRDDWEYTAVETEPLTSAGLIPVSDGESAVIVQEITVETDALEIMGLVPGRIRPDVAGTVFIRLKDAQGNLLREIPLEAETLKYDELNEIGLLTNIFKCNCKGSRIRKWVIVSECCSCCFRIIIDSI